MQRIHFCSGLEFTTGDAIATSLLRYARAVATVGGTDLVVVPALTGAGAPGTVTLLLNESAQISAETVDGPGADLLDPRFVERLDAERADLLRIPVLWLGEPEDGEKAS